MSFTKDKIDDRWLFWYNLVTKWINGLKDGNKIYVQVAYILSDESVVDREFNIYNNIQDNYPKYVLSMDKLDFSQNGIIHRNIIDWLLEDESQV